MKNVIIIKELEKLSDTKDILLNLSNCSTLKVALKCSKAINKLELLEAELLDLIQDEVEITKDNIHLYYEFMSDEDLEKYSYLLGEIFNARNWEIILEMKGLTPFDKRDTNFKVNWIDKTLSATENIVFGVKDTLKPIDEYTEEIKASVVYKEYISQK